MAKYITKTITRYVQVIICSDCGIESKLLGKASIKRWVRKNWYCKKCNPDRYKVAGLHCDICNHGKMLHYWRRKRTIVYEECKIEKCNCKKYIHSRNNI